VVLLLFHAKSEQLWLHSLSIISRTGELDQSVQVICIRSQVLSKIMASKARSMQVSLASSSDQCRHRVISDRSRKEWSDIPLRSARASWKMEKMDQKSGILVIMCMQACHMDPVEVIVSVQSRTKIMQVMRIVQSWAMPRILKRGQSRQLRSSGRF
jgi:hypothetical protein